MKRVSIDTSVPTVPNEQTFEFDILERFPTEDGDFSLLSFIHERREHSTRRGAVAIADYIKRSVRLVTPLGRLTDLWLHF